MMSFIAAAIGSIFGLVLADCLLNDKIGRFWTLVTMAAVVTFAAICLEATA